MSHEQVRTSFVAERESGQTLVSVLRRRVAVSRREVLRLLRERRVRVDGVPCTDPHRRLRRGQRLQVISVLVVSRERLAIKAGRHTASARNARGPRQRPVAVICYADAHVVVVDKPAGLTTVRHRSEAAEFGARARRFLPPTLADLLPVLLSDSGQRGTARVRAVHRLDKDTSGLVVFARTAEAERHLGKQFRAHSIDRAYVAVVRGRAKPGRIESRFVADRGDGRRGSTNNPNIGKPATTHIRVAERLGDFTLVECRPGTGRTHQIRIQLGESGTPLCGERVYDRPVHGRPLPDSSGAPRLALHAANLGFIHPATGKCMSWHSPLPGDLAEFVGRLRTRAQQQPHSERDK